jgi:hypothetical protein
MEQAEKQSSETVLDIVWRQQDPGDWIAEVRDTRTDQRRQVSSIEELEQFIQSQLCLVRKQELPSA